MPTPTMIEFLPSTKSLFAVMGHESLPEPNESADVRDRYPIWSALSAWENGLYSRLSKDQFVKGTWPSSPELLNAMRGALADQRGNYAGDRLAYALVRCGCRQPDTIASLCMWDSQLFRWRDAGLSAHDLYRKCQAAGVAGIQSEENLQRLDDWLSDPGAALAHYSSENLSATVLNGRMFSSSLYHNGGWPDYADFVSEMFAHAVPPITITDVVQSYYDGYFSDIAEQVLEESGLILPAEFTIDPKYEEFDTIWQVKFSLSGKVGALFAPGDTTWLSDVELAKQFDKILIAQGRPERVIRFGNGRNDEGSFAGDYIIAEPVAFTALCNELGIPLHPFGRSVGNS